MIFIFEVDLNNPDLCKKIFFELFKLDKNELKNLLEANYNDNYFLYENHFMKLSDDEKKDIIDKISFKAYHFAVLPKDSILDIKKYGLMPLREVLLKDTYMHRFLSENNIEIDFERNAIIYKNIRYDSLEEMENHSISSDVLYNTPVLYNTSRLLNRISNDYQLNAFLVCKKDCTMITEECPIIENGPEFLSDIFKFINRVDLIEGWKKNSSPYLFEFVVRATDLENYENCDDDLEEIDLMLFWIIDVMISCINGNLSNDETAYLHKDIIILNEKLEITNL